MPRDPRYLFDYGSLAPTESTFLDRVKREPELMKMAILMGMGHLCLPNPFIKPKEKRDTEHES